MKKIFVAIFLGISALCYSQDFIDNPDYIYGMGQTDSAAVASLSMSIGVKVENEVSYNIVEEGKQVTTKFFKNSGMSSSRFLNGIKTYYDNGIYYRYINKKEYINNKIALCEEYESKADMYDSMQIKHRINLTLGYYYKAYTMLNDALFIALTGNRYDSWKETLKLKAKSIYKSGDYGELFLNEKVPNGYGIVTNRSSKSVGMPSCLFAFEYLDSGVWKTPYYFKQFGENSGYNYSSPNDKIYFDKCYINSKTNAISYRYIYEDEYGKINVPDEWYFAIYKIVNIRNLN